MGLLCFSMVWYFFFDDHGILGYWWWPSRRSWASIGVNYNDLTVLPHWEPWLIQGKSSKNGPTIQVREWFWNLPRSIMSPSGTDHLAQSTKSCVLPPHRGTRSGMLGWGFGCRASTCKKYHAQNVCHVNSLRHTFGYTWIHPEGRGWNEMKWKHVMSCYVIMSCRHGWFLA